MGRPKKRGMNKEQREAIAATVCEFTDIKYEISKFVDDELIELGGRLDKAIENLIKSADVAAFVNR